MTGHCSIVIFGILNCVWITIPHFPFQLIKKMDFAVMGTSNYELVRRALDMFKESWLNGPLHAEVYVIQKFCERILNVLDLLEKITGSRIANDIGWHGEVTTLSEREAVPDSLQQLVLKMEAFEDPSVSTNLARFARALIDAAWSGRMCEKQLGRKIPLAVAIRRSVSVLIDAMKSYIDKFTDVFSDNEVVEGNFDAVKFRNNALDTAEVSRVVLLVCVLPCPQLCNLSKQNCSFVSII